MPAAPGTRVYVGPPRTCDWPVREDLVQQDGREGAAAKAEAYMQACRRVHQCCLSCVDVTQQLPRVGSLPVRACVCVQGVGQRQQTQRQVASMAKPALLLTRGKTERADLNLMRSL